MTSPIKKYTESTYFFDYLSPQVKEFASKHTEGVKGDKDQAIALYFAVRDAFLYNPYRLDIRREGLVASKIFEKTSAWCVEKASLYIACCRFLGIPAKPGYAIVVNHIGTEKLASVLKRKEIVFHGYASVLIDEKWIKVTPAFDKRICKISKVEPLDFDGISDAMLQAYNGNDKFMEYIHDYGFFDDVPVALMNAEMKKYYPHLFNTPHQSKSFWFQHE